MGTRIIWAIVIVLAAVGIYYGYERYKQKSSDESGAVHCVGCMSKEDQAKFDLQNSGDAPVAPGEHTQSRALQAANEAATPTQEPAAATPPNMAPQPSVPAGGIMPNNGNSAQPQNNYTTASTMNAPGAGAPMTDSQAANAPNGMRFTGSGTYQWYRQGNLTWRIDTTSGRSCIVYATMEEWRKQIVMSHGCGSAA